MDLQIVSDRDLVNCYKSLQKLNEDCEKLRAQLKELEEAALPIASLLVPHPGGPKIKPLVDRLREAPGRLATYVKHLAKSIPNQILAYMKSYFPKVPVHVVAGGLAANCTESSMRSSWSKWRRLLSKSPRSLTFSSPLGLACSNNCINKVVLNLFKYEMRKLLRNDYSLSQGVYAEFSLWSCHE
jgi:hypothetical protein